MSQKGIRANLLPIVLFLAGLAAIDLFDQSTHQDLVSVVGTIVLCAIVIVQWIWRGRYA